MPYGAGYLSAMGGGNGQYVFPVAPVKKMPLLNPVTHEPLPEGGEPIKIDRITGEVTPLKLQTDKEIVIKNYWVPCIELCFFETFHPVALANIDKELKEMLNK